MSIKELIGKITEINQKNERKNKSMLKQEFISFLSDEEVQKFLKNNTLQIVTLWKKRTSIMCVISGNCTSDLKIFVSGNKIIKEESGKTVQCLISNILEEWEEIFPNEKEKFY